MTPIKIILAEDHNIVRNGIRTLLEKEGNMEVVAEASNAAELIQLLPNLPHDLKEVMIITDINMPGVNGIDMIPELLSSYPELKIVILSMLSHEKYIAKAFQAGAMGYILKNVTPDELLFALRHIFNNNVRYVCNEISLQLLDKQLERSQRLSSDLPDVEISRRENEILHLIAEGYTNQEIADKLFTSKRTVEGHRQNLIDKTQSRNSASLIRFAVLKGLID